MKKILFVLTALSSVGAMANITCEKDLRPVDGNYHSVRLVDNEKGLTDVYYTVVSSGFGGPEETTKVLIAKDLRCQSHAQNQMVTDCRRMSAAGETINSGLSIELIQKSGVFETVSLYQIRVYSPLLLEHHGMNGYPPSDYPGRAEFEFNAKPQKLGMTNRCIAHNDN